MNNDYLTIFNFPCWFVNPTNIDECDLGEYVFIWYFHQNLSQTRQFGLHYTEYRKLYSTDSYIHQTIVRKWLNATYVVLHQTIQELLYIFSFRGEEIRINKSKVNEKVTWYISVHFGVKVNNCIFSKYFYFSVPVEWCLVYSSLWPCDLKTLNSESS